MVNTAELAANIATSRAADSGTGAVGELRSVVHLPSGPPVVRRDPRWDVDAFLEFCEMHAPFVTVATVRTIAGGDVPAGGGRASLPSSDFQSTLGDAGKVTNPARLFAVLSPTSFDRSTVFNDAVRVAEAKEIIAILDQEDWGNKRGDDSDLIFWDFLSIRADDEAALLGLFRLFTIYRVQVVIVTQPAGVQRSVFERLEPMAYLSLSAFCQRIVNHDNAAVQDSIELEKLIDLPNLLAPLESDHATYLRVAFTLERVIKSFTDVTSDAEGFRVFCEEANIACVAPPLFYSLYKYASTSSHPSNCDPSLSSPSGGCR